MRITTKTTIAFALFTAWSTGVMGISLAGERSGALSLLENSDAKYAALGETGTAASNDVSVMDYNPAGLGTLQTGQASFFYQKGLIEDSFGRFMIGTPTRAGSLALSMGYYDAGTIDVTDGSGSRSVTAQKDYLLGLGYARGIGRFAIGANAKFLRSTLAEKYTANAAAADLGLQSAIGSRLRLGVAVQNLGSGIKYVDESDPLPTTYRVGAAFALRAGANAPTLLLDVPYLVNESETRPSLGLDVPVGPLSLRAGYKDTGTSHAITVGAGFNIGRASLDYAMAMASELSAAHRVSLGLRFGGASTPALVRQPAAAVEIAQKPVERVEKTAPQKENFSRYNLETLSAVPLKARAAKRTVYIIQPGDSLATIARQHYGDSREWRTIYTANRSLLSDPKKLKAGQKIILP